MRAESGIISEIATHIKIQIFFLYPIFVKLFDILLPDQWVLIKKT